MQMAFSSPSLSCCFMFPWLTIYWISPQEHQSFSYSWPSNHHSIPISQKNKQIKPHLTLDQHKSLISEKHDFLLVNSRYKTARKENSKAFKKAMYACVLSHFSCVWLFVTPMDCSPPDSSIHGVLQTWILEWVALPSSRGSSWLRDETWILWFSCFGRQLLYH